MTNQPPLRLPTAKERRIAAEYADAQRFRLLPAKGGRVAALGRLHSSLAESAAFYRKADLQGQRDAVFSTIEAIREFLAEQGFAPATLEPLMRPALALAERELNILDPLFAARARGGRPSRSLEHDSCVGAIAVIAEHWLAENPSGEGKQKDRHGTIARKLSGPAFGTVSAARVKSARELVNQESKESSVVRWAAFHRSGLKAMSELFGSAGAVTAYIDHLNSRASSEPPAEI